jgi:hypothetical protein
LYHIKQVVGGTETYHEEFMALGHFVEVTFCQQRSGIRKRKTLAYFNIKLLKPKSFESELMKQKQTVETETDS